tara:strand:+ start:1344 stop:1730 length:387 start_codon:yes stop_codon:yes gene_type:complete
MPVALVPEGFTLETVSKQQKEALDNFNNKEIIKTLASSGSSGIAVLTIGAIVVYGLYKGFKIPKLNIVESFAAAFPQLSAILGVERQLSETQAQKIRDLLEEFVNDPTSRPFFVDKDKVKEEIPNFGR